MAETLGSLCDKLTIVKLKQYHTDDIEKLNSLNKQKNSLIEEINLYFNSAINGEIPIDKLSFSANKVYKKEGNNTRSINGNLAELFSELAKVNCDLWHEQEKVYEFEKVPSEEKNNVVKKLAILNLERNICMDSINNFLIEACKGKGF